MPVTRTEADAEAIRRLGAPAPSDAVAEILAAVAAGGDAALIELEERFGGAIRDGIAVDPGVIAAAPGQIDAALLDPLRMAITNVRRVADAQVTAAPAVELAQGQTVTYRAVPVRRAAAYVPGGRGSYPSTAVMCLTTAAAAGVDQTCVLSPAREDGEVDLTVLAVCALLGVDEVYRVGGAQAVAAAAYGTATIRSVDVVVGPGNSYVQEAKRQLAGRIGIDSVAGPSELVVIADATADAEVVALDLMAQGEHGPDSLVCLIATDEALLADVERRCGAIECELALVQTGDLVGAVALAEAIAPEHLQLMVAEAVDDELARGVTRAGAVFVGHNAATAFGDYVAGSNHVLPTGGSARFSSALSVDTFRRRIAEIRVPDRAVGELADAGAAIARAEGFIWHARSMEARKK